MDKKINEFLSYLIKEKKYSEYTKKNYELDIIEFKNYLLKEKIDYLSIDYEFIKGYLVELYNKKLSTNTISRKLSSLRSFYKYLFNNNIININPFKYIASPKKEKKLPKYIGIEELEVLFEVPNISTFLGQRDRLILEVLYATGVRVSELVNIKLNDIDYDKKEIRILGKGNKERIVCYGDYCKDFIDLFLRDGRNKILKKHKIASDYLIINEHGRKITTRGVELIINKIVKQACLKRHLTPHIIRHTFATHLLNQGCDILTIEQLLGHSSLETTQIYTHVSSERLKRVYLSCHPRSRKNKEN